MTKGLGIADIGKYLGFPMEMSSGNASSFQFLIDKFRARLEGWQADFLSKPGRMVLIDFMLNTIPSYIMQCMLLPPSTYNALDGINGNFLWGSYEERRRMHLVNWGMVTLPRDKGGLGILRNESRDLALLGSLAWRTLSEDRPWAKLTRNRGRNGWDQYKGNSLNKTALLVGSRVVSVGSKWGLGTGESGILDVFRGGTNLH